MFLSASITNIDKYKGDESRPYFVYLSKYCFLLASLLFALAPLINDHYFPWPSFYHEFTASLGLIAVFFGLALKFKRIQVPFIALAIFLISLIPLAQLIFGQTRFSGDAVMASAYLFGFGCAIVAGWQLSLGGQDKFLFVVAASLVFAAVISVFIALDQWLNTGLWGIWAKPLPPGGRPYANIGQPNNLATLLCMALVSVFYLKVKDTLTGYTAFILALMLFFGLALTGSRTAWLIVGIMLLWMLWKRGVLSLNRNDWFSISFLSGFYICLIFTLPAISDFLYLSAATREATTEIGVRAVIWSQLLDAVWGQPIWGYGWNQLTYGQLAVVADSVYPQSVWVNHSHNLFIDLLIWNGLFLGLLFIIGIIWWGLKRAFLCDSAETWFCLACIGAVAVHSMLEYPIEYAYFLFPLGLLVGSVTSTVKGSYKRIPKVINIPKSSVLFVLLLGCMFTSIVFLDYRKIEEDMRLLRFENARIGNLKAEQKAPGVFLLNNLSEYLRFARTEPYIGMTSDEIQWTGRVAHRYAFPSALLHYSRALFLNGRPEDAKIEMILLRQLHGEDTYTEARQYLRDLSSKYPQLQALDLP